MDFDRLSQASSNPNPMDLNDEDTEEARSLRDNAPKYEDDDEISVNIDIEEILQQIIALKQENFEQLSQNFPSLRQIVKSAEKCKRSGNPETTFTQFSQRLLKAHQA